MTGWVLRIAKMIFEVLFEKLLKQVAWNWPKKLFESIIGNRIAGQQLAPMIERGSNSAAIELGKNAIPPAAMGPQHRASNYRLRRVAGALVYEFHADVEDGHDSCWACQKCFDDGRVSLLQPNSWTAELYEDLLEWYCTDCDRSFLINQSDLPPNW